MNARFISGAEVRRPHVTPLTSSILDHATVVQNDKFGMRNDAGLWPSYNCLDMLTPTDICPDVINDVPQFQTADWQPAYTFALRGAVKCSAVGLDKADMEAELRRVFAASEGKGVEQSLLYHRFVESGSGDPGQWGAPTDLTPSGPTTVQGALALLEGYAAMVYSGVPTIHMPRAVASLLGDRIQWEGDRAFTRLGSKVAIGGGYDEPGGGLSWDLYATGEVYVERSKSLSFDSYVIPGDGSGTGSDENGLEDNTVIALAERMFRVAVDCFTATAKAELA